MTEEQFWELIEKSGQGALDCESQAHQLKQILCDLTPSQIIEFDRIFLQKRIEAYRWDLWGVAHLIFSYCSDDGFEDFRCWLVGQGQQAFESVLQDPEVILDLLESKGLLNQIRACPDAYISCESLPCASDKAYETLSGAELPEIDLEELAAILPREPYGQRWDLEDLPTLFPRVARVLY